MQLEWSERSQNIQDRADKQKDRGERKEHPAGHHRAVVKRLHAA
jgi:hypothetical protein